MNRPTVRALFVVILGASAAVIGWAQAAERGTVNGSVTGSGGPVVGVRVVIERAVSSYTDKTTTDQKGTFNFSDAPVGGITVKVYDPNGNVLVSGQGTLKSQGDIITLALQVP